MMYELEFILMQEQRAMNYASRQQIHDTNSLAQETYLSKIKGIVSRNSNVTKSNSQCCVQCC